MEVLLISHSTGDILSPLPGLPGSHSQRFSDGIEVSGRLAACWKMSEPWKPCGTQSFTEASCAFASACRALCLTPGMGFVELNHEQVMVMPYSG